jgi:hypothetical protein
MIRLADYYHIYTASPDPCTMDPTWRAEAEQNWLCKRCNGIKPAVEAVDVMIQERTPGDAPLNIVFGASGVAIARLDLIEELGEDTVRGHCWLGKVLLSGGKQAKGWVTCRGKKRVIVRGTKNARYRRCEGCETVLYYAVGPRYLCPAPPPDLRILGSDLDGLVLKPEVFGRLLLHKWTKLYIEKLPVRAVPRDGLPVSLEDEEK